MGRRGCDVCRSSLRRGLYEQRFVNFDGDAGLLAGYDVVTCAFCGFVYADGIPGAAVFERYYRDMSKHEPESAGQYPQRAYRQHNVELISAQVAKRLPEREARILDVGVGNAEILVALRDLGYRNLTGLDPSPRTADVVAARHGLCILNMPISEMQTCNEKFDIILFSGVLEHLRDVRTILSLAKALLHPNGRICVAVPNAERFTECVESPYQYLSVEHINFFTPQSLESLFAVVGMRLQSKWDGTALLGVFKEPIILAIFEAGDYAATLSRDSRGEQEVARYVAESKTLQDSIISKMRAELETGEPLVVWGTGSLTMHMLSDSRFAELNIVAFVDANAKYWDKTINGVRIISPASVADYTETVLVVSYSYEDEICSQIRSQFHLRNKVVRLFGISAMLAAF